MTDETESAPLLRNVPNQSGNGDRHDAVRDWLENNEEGKDDKGIPSTRIKLGVAYMLAMGVCGIVLVAIGSTLEELAEQLGTTSG